MSHHDGNPPALEPPSFPELRIRPDPPRILMLYGSQRERSYSRLLERGAGVGACWVAVRRGGGLRGCRFSRLRFGTLRLHPSTEA